MSSELMSESELFCAGLFSGLFRVFLCMCAKDVRFKNGLLRLEFFFF